MDNHDELHEGIDTIEIEMEDENGNVIPCEIVDGFMFEEQEYAVVKNKEEDSIYLFKVVGDDEEAELVLPSDEEFDAAAAYYDGLVEEDYEEDLEDDLDQE
ncbi:DUF1292 domain-containing protein [Clostridium grantii]|uniref:Uncharacterized protein n=1 Tax=Clostridium grantii DSM 8605 TaxID=1121316 RepID=A0A1M5SIJ1_9CLOT|nr:DUF1292 domain-containing protein [Clostridium grantii]SHH38356.1 Protein of unknown function [Clostridium grantii DSM 8605]